MVGIWKWLGGLPKRLGLGKLKPQWLVGMRSKRAIIASQSARRISRLAQIPHRAKNACSG